MSTKTISGGFCNPRKKYPLNFDYSESVSITSNQRRTLRDLIYSNIQDEDERENRLLEIENLTSTEAENEIFQFLSASWH